MEIRYKTLHGVAEWVEYSDQDPDTLTFSFEPYHQGALLLGGKILTLNNGEVTIAKNAIPDGEYDPKLESDNGAYAVEGFTKNGEIIAPHHADEALIRRLVTRCHSLEEIVTSLDRKVSALEKACHGHQIFDFERKEK